MSSELIDAEPVGRYQLIGTVDGTTMSFTLWEGELSVGSLTENDIFIPIPTVSRHHAVLQVGMERIVLRDIGSKNGTWVNGARITQAEVRAGDTIGFASANFRVRVVDVDDAVLAIVTERRAARGISQDGEDRDTQTKTRRSSDAPPSWIEVADVVAAHLLAPSEPDIVAALRALVDSLGASGGVVAEVPHRGEPVMIAVTGGMTAELAAPEVQQQIAHARKTALTGDAFAGFLVDEPVPLSCAVAFLRDSLVLLVGVTGTFHRRLATPELLRLTLRMIVARRAELRVLSDAAVKHDVLPDIVVPPACVVCQSKAMQAVYNQIKQLRQGDIPVLITGETGVGKEHIARILHASSQRADGPFVVVNCAAIPSELLEAELFGIERGVATGVDARKGKFELAAGGTILLDEIADMSADLQAKLLRTLQEMEVHPLGARLPVDVDVRVISATNADLQRKVAENLFRRDLYFRIAGFELRVPPLRERREDIPALVEHFMRRYAEEIGKPLRGITVKALRLLTEAPWPGNVRELEHEVRRLVYLCPPNQAIDSSLLSESVLSPTLDFGSLPLDSGAGLNLEHHTAVVERKLITLALTRTRGNRSKAAKLLGISRNGLALKMNRLGIR